MADHAAAPEVPPSGLPPDEMAGSDWARHDQEE